jgi:hypothetical protein
METNNFLIKLIAKIKKIIFIKKIQKQNLKFLMS